MLSVTFDQQTAAENPKAVHLWVAHPLVRQAANFFKFQEPKQLSLATQNSDIDEGEYRFALFRWTKRGVREDEALIPISSDPKIENMLLPLFKTATTANKDFTMSQDDLDELEAAHHSRWMNAQADHIDENRNHVEYRIQSLTISHRARCKAIEDQIVRASNDKIVLMKRGELTRANADFDRRIIELQNQANSGDIHASPLLYGVIYITKE